MAYVTDNAGILRQCLPSSPEARPGSGIFQSTDYVIRTGAGDSRHGLAEDIQGSKRSTQVPDLILSPEVHSGKNFFMPAPKPWLILVGKSQKRHDASPVSAELRRGKIGIQYLALKYRICFRIAFTYDGGDSALNDACLFKGNLRKSGAEHVTMIEAYVSYHAQHRRDYVRAVQPSAQAGLYDCDVDLPGDKPRKGHGSGDFKERQVKMVKCLPPSFHEIPDFPFPYMI